MAKVDAVVIADGDDAAAFAGGETRGPVGGGVENGEAAGRSVGVDGEGLGGACDGRRIGLDVEVKAVVGELDVGIAGFAEAFVGGGVREFVSDVREPGAAGLELVNQGEGLFDGLVHGMGNIAEGVEDEVVEVFKERDGGFGKTAEIGEIRGAAEAEAEHVHVAVEERHGNDGNAEKLEGALDFVEDDAGEGAEGGLGVKDVGEGAADDAEGFLGAVNGHGGALADVEGANVVEALDVIGVAVGEQNGGEAIQVGGEGLGAEIGGGVNDDVLAIAGEEDGGTQALVVRIGGLADGTMAADRGNSHGSAGAENGEVDGRRGHGSILRRGRGWGKESCQFSVVSFQFKSSEREKITQSSQRTQRFAEKRWGTVTQRLQR